MDKKANALRLTSRDLAIFRWLWMLRVLSISQIWRLVCYRPEANILSNFDNMRKRLKRLCDAKLILSDTLIDTQERLYTLGQDGLYMLNRHLGIDQYRVYQPQYDTLFHVYHPLLVSECATRIVEALRQTEIELVLLEPLSIEFYHTHALADGEKRKHTERFITQEDLRVAGHHEAFRIRPDLVFALKIGQHQRLFFIEADRGYESRMMIAKKQKGYHHYKSYPDPLDPERTLWQRYGDMGDFRVLFVTTTARRTQSLEKALQKYPGFSLMALTTEAEMKDQHFFYGPIWRVNGEASRSLLKPDT